MTVAQASRVFGINEDDNPVPDRGGLASFPVFDLTNCGPRRRFVVRGAPKIPLIAHNCTQATAASLLRAALLILPDVVGHTHDEILTEVDESDAPAMTRQLRKAMTTPPSWGKGLPLKVDITEDWYYHK